MSRVSASVNGAALYINTSSSYKSYAKAYVYGGTIPTVLNRNGLLQVGRKSDALSTTSPCITRGVKNESGTSYFYNGTCYCTSSFTKAERDGCKLVQSNLMLYFEEEK